MDWKLAIVVCLWLTPVISCWKNGRSFVFEFSKDLTATQIQSLEELKEELAVDFLTHPRQGETTVVLLSEKDKYNFQKRAKNLIGFEGKDITEKVLSDIKKEKIENDHRRNIFTKFRSSAVQAPITYFPKLNEIYNWLKSLPQKYENVRLKNIGLTYEKRPMFVLIINSGKRLPKVFIESNIHAREWLSPATSIYIIDKILRGHNKKVTDKFEMHFLVVTNPDGYEFSHSGYQNNTVNARMWRWNRRHISDSCTGVDLNRNFDINFGGIGSSSTCGSQDYHGPAAFSEPETTNERNYILQHARKLKLYISLHTYSQMVIVPYCYPTKSPKDDARLRSLGKAAVDAFRKVGNITFKLGTCSQLGLGHISGSSLDWVKAVAKVPNAFVFELRPRSYLGGGFIVPPSLIAPSGEETLAAIVAMLRKL